MVPRHQGVLRRGDTRREECVQLCSIVGSADDIAVVAVAKHLWQDRTRSERCDSTGARSSSRLSAYKRLTTRRRLCSSQAGKKWKTITITVGDHSIRSSPLHPLPGLHIDAKLKFRPPTPKKSSRRKLYAHVVDSILLYGAPRLEHSSTNASPTYNRRKSAHRRACLRVIGGRPHVAYEATYVLAGIPPLALLADERARLYGPRREDAKDEERLATLSNGWQEAWDRSKKAPMDAPTDPKYRSVGSRGGTES
ncbi:unnamed protein product [Trichogramma brassicae]|uniref:Uncharacterized protein n=1 Tax=Trichogramma brassicae TaxID=86971 RepID=A0A6H5J7I5_9HYME|nr:unnamed protein product [Trichogramma brassicae]